MLVFSGLPFRSYMLDVPELDVPEKVLNEPGGKRSPCVT